ncbi:hypothetical protein BGX27_003545 [Mortierella sp. AM989]|nr:hypothetical protein BGX27_003545 [Mortierella sp. AM989]
MSTSTLQLLPTSATEIAQLDPATLASIPGVAYDLKRLKVYSSCLRCRAKKVKCDRKEPCSRCEKHKVECSYRELASVQLDIRQFQRHLTNPKIRKDGAGIITSTATPIITLPSGDTAMLSPSTTAAASLIAAAKATALSSNSNSNSSDGSSRKIHSEKKSSKNSSTSAPASPVEATASFKSYAPESNSSTDTESDTPVRASTSKTIAMARAKVNKFQRRKPTTIISTPKRVKQVIQVETEEDDDDDDDDDDEEVERVVLRDDGDSIMREYPSRVHSDVYMSSESENDNDGDDDDNVPIWQAQAIGKHKQTAHEQDMAETFGLAAYLKAKEMESGKAGQTINYEMELERALAQRMPTSFSRPDRSLSRARKYAQAGYSPALPYARPSYCQLSSLPTNPNSAPLVAAHCCCQIAAKQGQAPGTCYFSGNSNRDSGGYESSSVSPPPQSVGYEQGTTARIAYSPSYQPSYTPKDEAVEAASALTKARWPVSSSSSNATYSSMMPPPPTPLRKLDITPSSASTSPIASPRIELPPIYLPKLPLNHPTTPASSDLSRFQVGGGRDGDSVKAPLEIACKYNEPNVDAWDMIEKPISRSVPVTTKRGRSVKMEMGWILS